MFSTIGDFFSSLKRSIFGKKIEVRANSVLNSLVQTEDATVAVVAPVNCLSQTLHTRVVVEPVVVESVAVVEKSIELVAVVEEEEEVVVEEVVKKVIEPIDDSIYSINAPEEVHEE